MQYGSLNQWLHVVGTTKLMKGNNIIVAVTDVAKMHIAPCLCTVIKEVVTLLIFILSRFFVATVFLLVDADLLPSPASIKNCSIRWAAGTFAFDCLATVFEKTQRTIVSQNLPGQSCHTQQGAT